MPKKRGRKRGQPSVVVAVRVPVALRDWVIRTWGVPGQGFGRAITRLANAVMAGSVEAALEEVDILRIERGA